MTDAPQDRELRLRRAGHCRDCGALLPAGTRARWHPAGRTVHCLICPAPDWGTAGASAQRQFEKQEGRRRARLRTRWVAVVALSAFGALGGAVLASILGVGTTAFVALGAALPVLNVLATPQHIAAWRSGAAGERAVGARLDRLRVAGVLTLHDRRVPGRRTNIDHIAVSPSGIYVIDTKNHAGKVSATRHGLRVAGRQSDRMLTGVQGQVAVVREALADQVLPAVDIRGVLCFTRAELPWFHPSPKGIVLLSPRGLSRAVRRSGPLTSDQVHHLATLLAQRLPAA
jgi:hypothetical protein